MNFHDEKGDVLDEWKLEAGDDAGQVYSEMKIK
jgi:hypothetical protein